MWPPRLEHRRFDRGRDAAQQLEGGVVALRSDQDEKPTRSVNTMVASAVAGRRDSRLVGACHTCRPAELTSLTRRRGRKQPVGRTGGGAGATLACRRERVAEIGVTGRRGGHGG